MIFGSALATGKDAMPKSTAIHAGRNSEETSASFHLPSIRNRRIFLIHPLAVAADTPLNSVGVLCMVARSSTHGHYVVRYEAGR